LLSGTSLKEEEEEEKKMAARKMLMVMAATAMFVWYNSKEIDVETAED